MKFLIACIAILGVASAMPAVSEWTLQEISHAMEDPNTPPMLMPYLEDALNKIMMLIFQGTAGNNPTVTITLPPNVAEAIGNVPAIPDVITPIMPVLPVLPPGIVEVSPVLPESPVASEPSSPLVQIILNIAA